MPISTLKRLLYRLGRSGSTYALEQLPLMDRWSPATKAALLQLFNTYRLAALAGGPYPAVRDSGLRVFSQCDEDGILLLLFALFGQGHKRFVDIGSADGINSNCANLAVNFGWHGLFIDGDDSKLEAGRRFYANHPDTFLHPPQFKQGFVKRGNVNELIRSAGFEGEIDLLSIDIDGHDIWIWEVLEAVRPRVVMLETHVEFGERNIAVPYDDAYVYPGRHPDYHGASPEAMLRMGRKLGYRLVGANGYGFNTFFVRADLGEEQRLPTWTARDVLAHPRNASRSVLFEPIRDLPYVEIQ